jgi:uncharacterized protein YbjT (DUF2867 family)
MSKTLIIGASGTVGSHLSQLLNNQRVEILRATSKSPTEPDQVQINLASSEGIEAALAQADRAFLLSPPGFTNQDELLKPVIAAAARHKLQKVVLMTAMGADADPNAPMRKAELALEESGVPFVILRPNWFMQNFHTFWIQGISQHDTIFLPVGDAKGSFIDARDISASAAAALMRHDLSNRAFDLTGAEALNHDQAAALISEAVGRTIRYQDISAEAMLQGLVQAGLPRPYAEFLIVILGFFKAGYSERTTDAVMELAGHAPRTFAQYVQDYKQAWRR